MTRATVVLLGLSFAALSLGCGDGSDAGEDVDALAEGLTTTVDLEALADTRMEQKYPSTNYATVNIWGNGTAGASTRSLMRFDVSQIPAGAVIDSARLRLRIANATVHPYLFNEVLRPWTETGATWNAYASGSAWAAPGADSSTDRGSATLASFSSAPTGLLELTLTAAGLDAVRRWHATPSKNNGFILRGSSSSSTDDVKIENRDSATPPVLRVTYTVPDQTPHGGTARAVPGKIEAEHFDQGGQNLAYYDTTAGNSGTWASRNPTDVDLQTTSDSGGGANVGWIGAGEWLEYTIQSATAATYLVEARVAALASGKTLSFRIGSGAPTADVSVPATGAWQSWATTAATPISVPAGTSILRVYTATGGFNLNWINVRSQTTSSKRLKVVSWNLQHSDSGATAQGDLLAQQNAHVIFTQEVWSSNAATIQSRLGAGWQRYFYSAENTEGVAVFTRMPVLANTPRVIGPSSWGGSREAVRVRIDVGGTPVDVFATHLDWPKDGIWGEDSDHANGRDGFLAWIETFSGHKIFGGDLNAHMAGNATQQQTILQFDAHGTDSCVSLGNTHSSCRTSYPTHGSSRLDYVYRSSGLQVATHATVSTSLSDHRLVVTEIDVP